MNKITTAIFAVVGFSSLTMAQQLGSDDPSFIAPESAQKIYVTTPITPTVGAATVQGGLLPCGGGTDTLIASGACSYVWSSDSAGTNILSMSDSLIFGPVTNDTSVYLTSMTAEMDSVAPLPGHGSVFSGNVRGYYFTAPVDIIITGLWVPTDADPGNQTVAVLLFDNQTPPPLWSSTTNAFTELGYWVNYPAGDTIPTCFYVPAGEVIGIYGWRGTANSYGTAPYQSMIGGIPTTFTRSGMQFNLNNTPMQDVFSESGGSISRTEFFYDLAYDIDTMEVDIVVPQPEASTVTASICQGDSVLAGGSYQTATGMYYDTLSTVYGCDSIVTTDLTVNTLPTLSFVADTLCAQDGSVSLNATPAGGTFSGTNVSGGMFDATTAGAGSHLITYDYADTNGCSNTASADFIVEDCAGLAENTLEGVRVFPNPVSDELQIVLPDNLSSAKATLYDAKGRMVRAWDITSVSSVNVSNLSAGMYVVEVVDAAGLSAKFRVVKK